MAYANCANPPCQFTTRPANLIFAGGVAAAIYARYRGRLGDGKDVNTPLAGIGHPDILCVGAAFGIVGYVIEAVGVISNIMSSGALVVYVSRMSVQATADVVMVVLL